MATEPQQRQISPVFIVAGAAGVLVVLLLVFNLLTGGGGEEEPFPTSPPVAAPSAPTPGPTPEPMEVFEIFEGKDPFRPLVFERPSTPDPSATAAPGAPTPAPATGAPPPGVTPTPIPRTPSPAGVQIELLDVADDRQSATVRVGSQVHQGARPGQTLSSGVTLVSIQGNCGTFRKDPNTFTICEGDMVLK